MTDSIITTSALSVSDLDGQLVVDSRLIAEQLGIKHDSLFATIEKHYERLSAKNQVRFQIELRERAQGGKSKLRYALLDERQATLLMTYSRNTEQVLDCKDALVDAFGKAKSIIKTVIPAQNDRIRELELMAQIAELDKERQARQDTRIGLHGLSTTLLLEGKADSIVRDEVKVTEVINLDTGTTHKFLSADQLKVEVQKRTGQKVKSLKAFTDEIRKAGRDDLLVAVTRQATSEYVSPDRLDEAIGIVYGKQRQKLLGE